jgi:DNA-binding NtrC family response regulator
MAKPAVKQAKGKLLYGEANQKVVAEQVAHFERAGYQVETAIGRAAIVEALRHGNYCALVLGHTLTKDDRHHIPYMSRKADAELPIMVLHASGKHHEVDVAIDSRYGFDAVIRALDQLVESRAAVMV